MFNQSDLSRDAFMLKGELAKQGYDWWWHSFTGIDQTTGKEKSFFVEFFTCNPELGGAEPVLGQLPANQMNDVRPSYLMVKAGAWGEDAVQLHRFFGWNNVKVNTEVPFHIGCEDCYLDETSTHGHILVSEQDARDHLEYMCGAGEIAWDLKICKEIAYNVGFGASRPLRDSEAFEMYWHAEGMKTAFEGTVVFNGKTYTVDPETSYGYADKNWGKDFTSPWVWLSSNHLVSKKTGKELKNSVFDIGGGRPKIGHLALENKLLSAFYYEGKEYEFNFSKFWMLPKTQFLCQETDTQILWHVEQETPVHKMVTDIACMKKDMLLVNYEAPDGSKRHNRLWNGGNGTGTVRLYENNVLIDEVAADHVGCEYGEYTPSKEK
jgi:tocopherol cyclase